MAKKSTRSKPPSGRKGKGEEPCLPDETFRQAIARLRSEQCAEVSPLLVVFLNNAEAQAGGALLHAVMTKPQRGMRLLPDSSDLPPLP